MARQPMFETPAGPFQHPWINNPDTKFNPDGVFQNTLVLPKSDVNTANLLALIDEHCQTAFNDETAGLSKAELKKWSVYKPYEDELDEDGEETGNVKLHFKRNHIITLKGGEKRELSISVYDTTGTRAEADTMPSIYGGTVGKVLFAFRNIKVPSAHLAGCKLDFAAVKIIQLKTGGGSDPFSKDDDQTGGYVHSRRAPAPDETEGGDGDEVQY